MFDRVRPFEEEGRRFALGIGVHNRTIPFEILPQALTDLTALRKERGVPDSVFEVELILVEALNALLPEHHDVGLSIRVLITLEGRPPIKSRLGELNTFAITISCVTVLLTVAWYARQYRKARKRQQKEERPLVHNILSNATIHSILAAPDPATPASGKRSIGGSTFSLLRSRRKEKIQDTPMTGDYLLSPASDSLMGKSAPPKSTGPSHSDGSSDAGPSLNVPTLSFGDTGTLDSVIVGSPTDSLGVHVTASLPATVDNSIHMQTLSARSGAHGQSVQTTSPTGATRESPGSGTSPQHPHQHASPLRSSRRETPRKHAASGSASGSPAKSSVQPVASPQRASSTPRRTTALRPPVIEVDHAEGGNRSSSLSPEPARPVFPVSPHSNPETTVLTPGGVSLFGTAHMVAHNSRVRQLRAGSGKTTGGDRTPI